MYRDVIEYCEMLGGNNLSFGFLLQIILFTGFFITFYSSAFAQWASDPSVNTKLVVETVDPINISAVSDLNGGAFIFWQDNKSTFQSDVYFIHVDNGGKVNLRADGKKVSTLTGPEENPVSAAASTNSAVVVWDDYTNSANGSLFAQRVLNNGNYVWDETGLQITRGNDAVSEFSIGVDNAGSTFISFIAKEPELNGDYKVEVQKITAGGKLIFDSDEDLIFKSRDRKMMTSVVPDDDGGAYVFWIEMQNGRSMIFGQHISAIGKKTWGTGSEIFHDKPLDISSAAHNVITYKAKKLDDRSIYIAWQSQKKSKDIYHQLISPNGKPLWERGGKLATAMKGNQLDPQAVCTDSSIILSWTNERGYEKDIYLEKYNKKGKPLWNKIGEPLIKIHGDQFGQRLISDGRGGIIAAWIDRRTDSLLANIYSQRINGDGKKIWDSLGVVVASSPNTLKSYLSLVPDESGGAIAIFKNSKLNKNDIYGQKIYSTGTYASQIVSLSTSLEGDSIKISWYSANEKKSSEYNIERALHDQNGNVTWDKVGAVNSDGKSQAAHYDYYDVPDTTGTLYYRVVQSDSTGDKQISDISSINYFGSSSKIVVAQNLPNPFSDSTVISFYLPDPASVTIEFFDDHVDKISEIDKSFPAGENNVTFYSKGLKPGIYFYRLKAGDFVDVKKMVITN